MTVQIHPINEAAIIHVAEHISKADELEILTVSSASENPLSVEDCLRWSVDASQGDSFAIHPILDGKVAPPVALFGVVNDEERSEGMGVVWMVCTDMLVHTSRDIMKIAPGIFEEWFKQYPNGLHNRIDTRNERHLRWIKKFGADVPGPGVFIRGVPFAYFVIAPRRVAK